MQYFCVKLAQYNGYLVSILDTDDGALAPGINSNRA